MDNSNQGLFQAKEINIRELLFHYLHYWYVFLVCVLISGMIAFFYLRYNVVPQYYISSTLLIKEDSNAGVLPTGMSLGMSDAGKTMGSEMIILRSQNLMQRVFLELGINTSYYYEGRVRDIEVYEGDLPISLIISELHPTAYGKSIKIAYLDNNNFNLIEYGLDGKEIISSYKFGQEIKKPFGSFTIIGSPDLNFPKDIIVVFHDSRKLAEKYSGLLTVDLVNKDANVLRLGLMDAIPQRSMIILNKLVEVYKKEAIEDKNQVDLSTIEFLDERISFLSTELSDVEREVEQYKQQNNLTDVGSNAQIYLESASQYNKEVESFDLQLEILNSLEEYIHQEDLRLVPSSLNIQDPTLNGLIAKFNEMQLERQRMLRTIQPSSSLIQNLDDQLLNLRSNIIENLKNIKSGLLLTRDNLRSTSSKFQSKIRQVPAIERELMEINRQQGIKHTIYLFLLQRREEAGLSLASTISNSRIVDPAKAIGPFNNKSSTIYLTAMSLGLLIPFGFIFIKNLLNDKVKERKDVEELTDIPILGEIFRFENKEFIQVFEKKNTIIAENLRLIRANLNFCSIRKENKVILITSNKSGEGKSSFSINLGKSLALAGKKVVILEFDLRNPQLSDVLGISKNTGIVDFIISPEITIESIIQPITEVGGLYLIGSGTKAFNPGELIMHKRVEGLLNKLKEKFDRIIIDTSPIGLVADAFSLGALSDSSIYIVRYNYTTKSEVMFLDNLNSEKKINYPLIVLNDAKKKKRVYGYGYDYGGIDLDKKKRLFNFFKKG